MKQRRTMILGLGVTGASCVRHLAATDRLVVVDSRLNPPAVDAIRTDYPDVALVLGDSEHSQDYGTLLDEVDRLVVSPGIASDNCLLQLALQTGVTIENDIDLFCQAAAAPIYAVTGTNGKSTVTTLVGLMLGAAGAKIGVGGNLGTPALDLLSPTAAAYVLELSSFQLQRLAAYPFAAATILNISEDHLDRHGDMRGYRTAKQRIYAGAQRVVCNRDDTLTQPQEATAAPIVTFGLDKPTHAEDYGLGNIDGQMQLMRGDKALLPVSELHLPGVHNQLNLLAALALCDQDDASRSPRLSSDRHKMLTAAAAYTGLPHRGQVVAHINGVDFVNDSKATNLGATLAALQGLQRGNEKNLIVLLGGQSKGVDLSPLAPAVTTSCSHAVVFGECADELAEILRGPTGRSEDVV